jgi:hypothetical protein
VDDLARRQAYIEGYKFGPEFRELVRRQYENGLTDTELSVILEGLRSWFVACLHAEGAILGLPSRAVDDAWHEFILSTRTYHTFCDRAFGYYLHHTPELEMRADLWSTALTLDILETLSGSPRGDDEVPPLFLVDGELDLEDGVFWTPLDLRRLIVMAQDFRQV